MDISQVDSAATNELATEVEAVRNDSRIKKVTILLLANKSKCSGRWDGFHSWRPGFRSQGTSGHSEGSCSWTGLSSRSIFSSPCVQTVIAGLEALGSIFGENVNKEIAKLVAQVTSRARVHN